MKSGFNTHKRIHDPDGEPACFCPFGKGRIVTNYHWKHVTCKSCLKLKELNYNGKQVKEIARIRNIKPQTKETK